MGHLNFSTPANVPGQKGDTPLLDPDLMQLVFSLYSAQVSLHNAHLALNNIETSLHQSALHDPTLLPRAHFAYDALCQTLGLEGVPSLALDSSANPTAANGEATQPPTESTTLDYEKFVKTFTAAFPDSVHLFPSTARGLPPASSTSTSNGHHPVAGPSTSSGASANGSVASGSGSWSSVHHQDHAGPSTSASSSSAGTTAPSSLFTPTSGDLSHSPQHYSSPSPKALRHSQSPPPPSHLPTPSVLLSHQAQAAQDPSAAPVGGSSNSTLSDLLSISSFPPPASSLSSHPHHVKNPHHTLPPILHPSTQRPPQKSNSHGLSLSQLAETAITALSSPSPSPSPSPEPENRMDDYPHPLASRLNHQAYARGRLGSNHKPSAVHPSAQLLLAASTLSNGGSPPASRPGTSGSGSGRKRNFGGAAAEMGTPGMGREDREGSVRSNRSSGRKRRGRKRWDGDSEEDELMDDVQGDELDDEEEEEKAGGGKRFGSFSAGGSVSGGPALDEDGKKIRRQPRSMSYDDSVVFPSNDTHRFLIVSSKSAQPELSERSILEVYAELPRFTPGSPLHRVLSPGSTEEYTHRLWDEDCSSGSMYYFYSRPLPNSANGPNPVLYTVQFTPAGPNILSPLPSHGTTSFVHFPPNTVVTAPPNAANSNTPAPSTQLPIGSLPWWRLQSCLGETRHRGMPGDKGEWTARWDKDPRDRRPARIVEHFAKCRWRQGGDGLGRMARALLGKDE